MTELVLTRKAGESVFLYTTQGTICIQVTKPNGWRGNLTTKLRILAPRDIRILRAEIAGEQNEKDRDAAVLYAAILYEDD